MLGNFWNSIENSGHRNGILATIIITTFAIAVIPIFMIVFKRNKSNKKY